ncbi:tRNA synthetases class I (C) catalytic domain-containing protein [Calycina marina]|uniref:cysteine--tRNA ligase n=1 Tax=Calycina marina TaxID=1763456 RepID=A0A9P7Z3J9_9HELO|nr:tRNA synthetases class I (C) catalytic domain-containing protein [Calycina marina]
MADLKIHNSLVKKGQEPVPFIPIEAGKASWYACGPTVYDHSHLGHARNYVSTDIIRRIMLHYFGFKVNFVMNITDVDDKIILRARRSKLLEIEKKKGRSETEVSKLAAEAFESYAKENLPELLKVDSTPVTPENYAKRRDAAYGKVLAGKTLSGEGKPGDDEAKTKMHLSNLTAAADAILKNQVFGGADEILLPYLDSLYKETVDAKDHKTWTDVTEYWEDQFMGDMDALNVLRPDIITRVTAYVPQIATFVDKIIQKGFAYEADGSVYFDIAAFEEAGNTYARLRPQSKNDQALQEEGEGSLGKSLGGKKGPGDFALWKKSKAGEPSWPSPWGEGRPGWHIECSVMASDVLGSQMDIHSGGVDLAFPHHDNELAQSEAFYCEHGHEHSWVKNFLHMGHLSISGSKMSKSLKNFQTIRDALKTDYTPRNMRVVFLLGQWNKGVEISTQMRTEALAWEDSVNNFFINVKAYIVAAEAGGPSFKSLSISSKQQSLKSVLEKAEQGVNAALSDSFDTKAVLETIGQLISAASIHISKPRDELDIPGLEAMARFVTRIVGIFGLDSNTSPPYDGLGWATAATDAKTSSEEFVKPFAEVYHTIKSRVESLGLKNESLEKLLAIDIDSEFKPLSSGNIKFQESYAMPCLNTISEIREELRKLAQSSASKDEKNQLLKLSDEIRDDHLTELGVYLDDTPRGTLIKFVPKEELLAQKAEKAARIAQKEAEKEVKRVELERQKAEKEAKARVSPTEMFKSDDKYSVWDEQGIPTKLKDGKEVTASALKKIKKEWEKQKKVYDEWKAKSG